MTFIDRLRGIMGGSGKVQPRSDRDKKLAEISARVHDEDYGLEDYLPDDLLAEVAEDREAFGNDLEFPSEPIPSLQSQLDQEWLEKKLIEGKGEMKNADQKKIQELQEKYPNADIRWDQEYSQVWGCPGISFCQNGRYFNTQGKLVENPEI